MRKSFGCTESLDSFWEILPDESGCFCLSVTFTTQVRSCLFGEAFSDILKLQAELIAFFFVVSTFYILVINIILGVYWSVLPAILWLLWGQHFCFILFNRGSIASQEASEFLSQTWFQINFTIFNKIYSKLSLSYFIWKVWIVMSAPTGFLRSAERSSYISFPCTLPKV